MRDERTARYVAVRVPLDIEATPALAAAAGTGSEQEHSEKSLPIRWQVVPEHEGEVDLDQTVCSCDEKHWALRIRDLLNAEERSLDGRMVELRGRSEEG